MEELEEGVNIRIDETPEQNKVIDYTYSMSMLDVNETSLVTEVINAELKACIISSDNPVHINIAMAEYPDIVLYDNPQFFGTYYLPLKITAVSKSAKMFNPGPSNWYLNNHLIISLRGQKQTHVDIILRCC